MIGQGTAKPMIISVTNAGTYTFRLTVSDGQTSSSTDTTLTFVQPTVRTIFVDGLLSANCLNNNAITRVRGKKMLLGVPTRTLTRRFRRRRRPACPEISFIFAAVFTPMRPVIRIRFW